MVVEGKLRKLSLLVFVLEVVELLHEQLFVRCIASLLLNGILNLKMVSSVDHVLMHLNPIQIGVLQVRCVVYCRCLLFRDAVF